MCNLIIHFLFWQEDESFEDAASKTVTPQILVKGSIENFDDSHEIAIVAETMVLYTFQRRLVDAAVAFMATNYVFMLKYPGSLNNFCLFLQKCVLNINDGKKLPASVITLVNKLDKITKDDD